LQARGDLSGAVGAIAAKPEDVNEEYVARCRHCAMKGHLQLSIAVCGVYGSSAARNDFSSRKACGGAARFEQAAWAIEYDGVGEKI